MKYAVAFMDFFDNILEIQIIEAEGWKEALSKHTLFNNPDYQEVCDMSWMSNNLQNAKEDMIDSDMLFDVIQLE